MHTPDVRAAAHALGGDIIGRDQVLCPGPGPSPALADVMAITTWSTWRNTVSPSPSICSLNLMPAAALAKIISSVALRPSREFASGIVTVQFDQVAKAYRKMLSSWWR
jgi:hypothetical protein